jgi:hypothetical protein
VIVAVRLREGGGQNVTQITQARRLSGGADKEAETGVLEEP